MLVLLISPFLVKHHLEQRRLRAAIQRHFDAIRAGGLPVTGRELQALRPNPPPERDWRMVVEPLLITNELQVEAWELWHTNAPFDLVLPAIQRDLAANTQVLAVILQMDLSGLESRVDWPADPDEVFGRKFESFSKRIRLAEALGGQGVYEAATGHPERATAALVNSFAAVGVGDLCWVSFAIQQLCESCSFRALETAVNHGAFADADLLRLERALPHRATNSLQAAVAAERVGSIWLCELARRHPLEFARLESRLSQTTAPRWQDSLEWLWRERRELVQAFRHGFYRHSDFLALLDRYHRRVQACLLPLPERLKVFRCVDAEMSALDRDTTCLAVITSEPKFARVASMEAVNQVRQLVARTALAVERWRLAHAGGLPATLAELVPTYLPSVPVDPFDDQPIRFKRLPQGYVVYSVGPDGADNGGKDDPNKTPDKPGYDVSFSVGR